MTPKFITTIFAISAATALVPCAVLADSFTARSTVVAATLYPSGAHVTRHATVSVPAGKHHITFFDIPVAHETAPVLGLQTSVAQATLGPVAIVNEVAGDVDSVRSPQAQKALEKVEALEAQLKEGQRNVRALELEASAAGDTLSFINALDAPDDASTIDIAALALTIQEQSLKARLAMQDAKSRAEDASDALQDLTQELEAAKVELQKLAMTSKMRARITLEVDLDEAADVDVTFAYDTAAAHWRPTYKAHVDTVENTMRLDRSMLAKQATGEPWVDVDLTFSTERPSRRADPSSVVEYLRWISDPAVRKQERGVAFSESASLDFNAAPMAAMEMDVAQAQSYGLSLSFEYGSPATLYSGASGVTDFALAPVSLMPDLSVRAVPLHDETGYLIADITNDSGEVFLPGDMLLFRDGAFIGQSFLAMQPDGAAFEMGLGAIDGIKVSRVTLGRNEGDRGFITKSNATKSSVRLDVENLTTRTWPIEVVDRVSVSEQEDLNVEWTASPMPNEQGADDRRGVLSWRFDLPSGEINSITLDETLTWPEGKDLR
jgi:uncharacterized protein (TIGR02231 family)